MGVGGWCRTQIDRAAAGTFRRVIELEPNHAAARRALGYSQVNGKWTTQKEAMEEQGYVRKNGKWMLPQEVELSENKRELMRPSRSGARS